MRNNWRAVSSSIWGPASKVKELESDAARLYLYLLTCQSNDGIGIFYNPLALIGFESGIPADELPALIEQLEAHGLCQFDPSSHVWFIPETGRVEFEGLKPEDKRHKGLLGLLEKWNDHRFYHSFIQIHSEALSKPLESPSEAHDKPIASRDRHRHRQSDSDSHSQSDSDNHHHNHESGDLVGGGDHPSPDLSKKKPVRHSTAWMMDEWNAALEQYGADLRECQAWGADRHEHAQARLREYSEAQIRQAIHTACSGKGYDGSIGLKWINAKTNRLFKIDLPWLVERRDAIAGVLEGKYSQHYQVESVKPKSQVPVSIRNADGSINYDAWKFGEDAE